MAYPTLEQISIILNMFAVVLMGIDLFLKKDQINQLEMSLKRSIDSSSMSLKIFINSRAFKFIVLIALNSSILIYSLRGLPIPLNRIMLHELIYYQAYHMQQDFVINYILYIFFSIVLSLSSSFIFTRIFTKLEKIFLLIVDVSFHLLTISPKGVVGSIGVMLFILGSFLQLWSTF